MQSSGESMKQCSECMAYLSDCEIALCVYTKPLCIVCMPDQQAAPLNKSVED